MTNQSAWVIAVNSNRPINLSFFLLALTGILSGCLTETDSDGNPFVPDMASSSSSPPPPPATGNTPPNISGTPSLEVAVGIAYRFAADAFDVDGDPLTFSIENLPVWATFNTATGLLSGTPLLGDVGTYDNIVVTVSDGSHSISLDTFSINVVTQGSGSVTLNLTSPTQNEDGTALTDLAGYVIYYGTQSGIYDQSVSIDNPSVSTYVVDGLTANTYFFVATAMDSEGIESRYSGELIRQVSTN